MAEFRPMGSVRAECAVIANKGSEVSQQVMEHKHAKHHCCACKPGPVPTTWFASSDEDHENTLSAFQQAIADICANGDAERVRVNRVLPYAQKEVLVGFDVLPDGYTNDSKKSKTRVKNNKSKTDMRREHVAWGAKARKRLLAEFSDTVEFCQEDSFHLLRTDTTIKTGVFKAVELDLEIMVDLKDAIPQARFLRAVIVLCSTVLYYPVIQETLPILHCTAYATNRFWDFSVKNNQLGKWVEADLIHAADERDLEGTFINDDRSMKCDGSPVEWTNHFITSSLALVTIFFCVVCPLVALRLIRRPSSPKPFRVPLCAARTLNARGELTPRYHRAQRT